MRQSEQVIDVGFPVELKFPCENTPISLGSSPWLKISLSKKNFRELIDSTSLLLTSGLMTDLRVFIFCGVKRWPALGLHTYNKTIVSLLCVMS